MSEPLLSVRGVTAYYGHIIALRGVDLDINQGEIVALIGGNGAGKSTLMMTICGNPRARTGSISFDGADITHLPTHQIMRLAIAQAPEGRHIFPRMTVLENLQMGATSVGFQHFAADLERVYALFPVLQSRAHQRGGTLSGGEQQMLAIGRALISRPRLLLLDEPSLGLAPLIVRQIFQALRELSTRDGLTIFVVEQNAYHALKLADRGIRDGQRHDHHRRRGQGPAGARRRARGLPRGGRALSWMAAIGTESVPGFLLITLLLGGGAAYLIGRAVARTWRPLLALAAYLVLLDCAVRFIHFALAGDMLIAPGAFVIDLVVLGVLGALGFRVTRASQITRQYPWLYRRSGAAGAGAPARMPADRDPRCARQGRGIRFRPQVRSACRSQNRDQGV